ncbi:MAG: AI-2E family transporter [Paraburkholderia sp.]|uniref:AI-2E family transporter n=1 Tax=Paraburkholderia sp. TaxID=1926495 RepID=UPI00120CCF99|nr:AI-2E family transporter [Paraburkholderia sp.]TAM05139.1 MAG: AI-2E family transporter [Paraburkholderia sp.]TAM28854.1 MAG: AI-2E family transporter [Paraburkholderia sp.]
MDGNRYLHQTSFYLLLLAVSIALCFVLAPFFSAVLWGAILALIFQPVQRWLVARLRHRNLAALISLAICVLIVILPLMLVAATLVQQITYAYGQIRSGSLDIGVFFNHVVQALPQSAQNLLAQYDMMELRGLRQHLSAGAAKISQFVATRALSVGQITVQVVVSFGVMLYLFFFLVRDGRDISKLVRDAIPLDEGHKRHLICKLTTVIRATVKGNFAVAFVQGALGGIALWVVGIQGALLWGFVMMLLSLLPAVGAALVWGPAAIYLISSGALAKGIGLAIFGMLVIGTIDNVLRPVLVGKDTRLPDWVVLISTLGGMSLIGINGFVIGPLIAALFISCWDLLRRDQRSHHSHDNHDSPVTADDPPR